MGGIVIYGLFYTCCLLGLFSPWIGITAYFGFSFLNPEWNWPWAIPRDSGFQFWLFVCTAIGTLLRGFQGNSFEKWVNVGIIGLLIYLGISFISAANTIDPVLTNLYMRSIWRIIVTVIIAIRLLDTPNKLLIFMWVIVLAQGYNSYQINKSYYELGYSLFVRKKDWTWLGSNQVANRTLCVSAIAASLSIMSNSNWKRIASGASALLMLHEIMILESRGVMLGAIMAGAVFFVFLPKTRLNLFIIAIGITGVAMLAGPSVIAEFTSSFNTSEESGDASAVSRFDLWRAGYQIMLDYPLLGVGPYAASRLVPAFIGDPFLTNKGLHNLWFEIACGSGILAALCYFLFFFSNIYASVQILRDKIIRIDVRERAASLACVSGLGGFLIANIFSAGGLVEGSYVLAILGSASFLIHERRKQSFPDEDDALEDSAELYHDEDHNFEFSTDAFEHPENATGSMY
jgi:hypothetical protein